MFESLIHVMGNAFTAEQYLFWTRIQCAAWTAADLLIVLALIRIANTARRIIGKTPHLFSYVALALTLPACALIPLAHTGRQILLIELVVTVPHFLLILYILLADTQTLTRALKQLIP